MSELLAASAALVPVISAAAAGFAGAVVESAQTQFADSAVLRGRALIGRLLSRRPEDPPQTPEDADAAARIRALPPEDRLLLETAVGEWLAAGSPRDGAALHERIRDACSGDTYHVASHGPNSPAIGRIGEIGTMSFGAPPEGEAGR
ncbi:hypothetical protein V1J52_22945 [Streptomyces sp. TRM 70351]|uniref:hypothetical protein n=1 Tax=Streptomyces sp. TRM 70351 TaxID=3116552 RepID=UPI002E7B5621|nr:hypothetical protein [Streptomyces sp. TRM 70351]MEE1931000.1 hypothetical protein [Streptomyces sp. TRM 70351]